MAQYDREYFKKQFEGLPPNATAMIALRAAMRVFPVLARRSKAADPAFRFWTVAHSGRHTLAVCRSFQSLAFSLTNGSPAVSGRAFVNADAMLTDIAKIQEIQRPSRIDRPLRRADAEADPVFLLAQPLWRKDSRPKPPGCGHSCKGTYAASTPDSRSGSIGIRIGLMGSRSTVRSSGNGRCYRRSSLRKARPRSTPISRGCVTVRSQRNSSASGRSSSGMARGKTSLIRALHGED